MNSALVHFDSVQSGFTQASSRKCALNRIHVAAFEKSYAYLIRPGLERCQ